MSNSRTITMDEELSLYSELNREIFKSVKQLPLSLQDGVSMFLLQYSGKHLSPNDFFKKYPKPVWSILNDLNNKYKHGREIMNMSIQAQSLSLFIHSLDNHLADKQVKIDLAKIHLRTTIWSIFEKACLNLLSNLRMESELYTRNVDIYFSSSVLENAKTIDDYMNRSRRQSTLWQIVPLALSAEEDRQSVQFIIEQFISAYRIIDDIEDWKPDALILQKSSVYFSINEADRAIFNKGSESDEQFCGTLYRRLKEENIIHVLKEQAMNYLNESQERAKSIGFCNLADKIQDYAATQEFDLIY